MNYIIYFTILSSASLSWNPFIHFLHTIHIIPPPDIVTRWHILCLIYFCTIQVLIKQEQRSPHSWCHYTNPQKGAAPLFFTPAEWPSGFIIGQRARAPSPKTSAGYSTPLGVTRNHWAEDLLHPRHTFHWPYGKFSPLPVSTQSLDKWNIIIF